MCAPAAMRIRGSLPVKRQLTGPARPCGWRAPPRKAEHIKVRSGGQVIECACCEIVKLLRHTPFVCVNQASTMHRTQTLDAPSATHLTLMTSRRVKMPSRRPESSTTGRRRTCSKIIDRSQATPAPQACSRACQHPRGSSAQLGLLLMTRQAKSDRDSSRKPAHLLVEQDLCSCSHVRLWPHHQRILCHHVSHPAAHIERCMRHEAQLCISRSCLLVINGIG